MPVQGQNPFLTQDQWDKMYNLKRGLAVANMPLDQAIGYGIGAWLGNYLGRRDDNIASGNINNSSDDVSNTENTRGMLSGIENKGPAMTDTLGNNSEYVRQAVAANATMPENATLDQYNQMAADNRTIKALQNQQNNNIADTQAAQRQALQTAQDLENEQKRRLVGLAVSAYGGGVPFDNAATSDSEVAAVSLPERVQNISPFQQQIADKIKGDIVRAKYAYENAMTDNDRMYAQLQAQNARNLAAQYGLDVSAYGADVPAERAMLAAMNETPQFNADNATSQYASNPMSTQEYWQQLYEEARARGAGRTAAERYATQKAAAYQTGRINDLSAQFVQYGVNPDGSVGNLGMSILSQLRTEDPDAYTQLLSAYGMPRDVFATSQQIRRDNNTAQNQMAAMQEQGRINSDMQNQKFEQTKELEQLQAQTQVALYEAKAQIDKNYSNASIIDRMKIMSSWLVENGVDPQTAGLMAAGMYNSKGGKSSSTKEEKPPTYISEINNLVSQMDNDVNLYASFDGDSEEGENLRVSSGESIDAVKDYFDKNKEKFDSEDAYRIMTRMYAANYKRAMAAYYKTGNAEYKKQADEYKKYVPKNLW